MKQISPGSETGRSIVPVGRSGIEIRSRAGVPAKAGSGCVVLAIDCSGSMAGSKMEQARRGAVEFAAAAMGNRDAVGLVQFASTASVVCGLQTDLGALREHAGRLEAGGSTDMTGGIGLAASLTAGVSGPRSMVVITDGLPTKRRTALEAAERAVRDSVQVITIGTGDADDGFLAQSASGDQLTKMVKSSDLAEGIASSAALLPGSI